MGRTKSTHFQEDVSRQPTPCQKLEGSSRYACGQIKVEQSHGKRRPLSWQSYICWVSFQRFDPCFPWLYCWMSAPWTYISTSLPTNNFRHSKGYPVEPPLLRKKHYLRVVCMLYHGSAILYFIQIIRPLFRGYDRINSCRLDLVTTEFLPCTLSFLSYRCREDGLGSSDQ